MIQTLLILLLIGFILFIYFTFFKVPKLKNLTFIDGGLGTGKSCMTVRFAIGTYRKVVRNWYIYNFFVWWNRKSEYPLLYSNIPLYNIDYVPLTKDLLYRDKRFNYKSVILIDECSLLIDQMEYKNAELNERLSEFFKLLRHMSRGGYCIVNSQSISDMHYSFRYCLNDYFYIHSKLRLPFISILKIQEFVYSADNSVQQINDKDIEDNTKLFIIRNKYFKRYDPYVYSGFTDKKKRQCKVVHIDDRKKLKVKQYLTLKHIDYINEFIPTDYHCPKCDTILKRNIYTGVCTCEHCGYSEFEKVILFKNKKGEK